MVTRLIELTEEQDKALEEIAAGEGRSVSEVIRARMDNILQQEHPNDREEIKRRAVAAIGRFRSDVTDLATEHDRYLERAFGGEPLKTAHFPEHGFEQIPK